MKTKRLHIPITGMFWHVHHNKLCEWCYDYQERVDYIKANKSKNEIETRLRLFKKVKGKLPEEFVEAEKKWAEAYKKRDEAYEKWFEASKKRNEVWEKLDEAEKKWDEAYKKYLPEIEKLHKKECGCKEWNGKEIEFKEELK
jgi:hypothetical protein